MPPKNYRLYCLNEHGRINLANWITAHSDEEAIEKALEIEHGAIIAEVWEQNRLITTIKAGPAEAQQQQRSATR